MAPPRLATPRLVAQSIANDLRHFVRPGDVVELRILNIVDNPKYPAFTESGYFDFDHLDELARHAASRTHQAEGCYVTLNPVLGDLLARANNRAKRCKKDDKATGDTEVRCRSGLVFDADPQRLAGISATDAEKALAWETIHRVIAGLTERGWPAPILADSGNGYHARYAIDLANNDGARELIQRVLEAADQLWSDDLVKIDTSLFNASRIIKLYGTLARKGDPIDDRPHRWSGVLSVPDEFLVVPVHRLEAFAAEYREPVKPQPQANGQPPASKARQAPSAHPKEGAGIYWPETILDPVVDFEARTDWAAILPAGWKPDRVAGDWHYQTRPGKQSGVSASVRDNWLHMFTDNAPPFSPGVNYSKFDAFALVKHGGDKKAAKRDLAVQGFGTYRDHDGSEKPNPPPADWARRTHAATSSGQPAGRPAKNDLPPRDGPPPGINYDELEEEELGIEWADQVQDVAVEWINEKRLAAGKLHLTAGAGGLGKSQYAIAEVAAVTTGGTFPDGGACLRSGVCIILAAEDGKADTIVPRLKAAGADLSKVVTLRTTLVIPQPDGKPPLISFGNFQNLPYWEAIFKRLRPVVLVADPIPAFMGPNVNDHKNADVRRVLEPFVELLEKHRVAMEGVTHVGKSIKDKTATDQILGSVAYANLARRINIAWLDPEVAGRYVLTNPKLSLGPLQKAVGYTIEAFNYDKDGKTIETSKAKFEEQTFEADEYELRCGQKTARRGKARGPEAVRLTELTTALFDFLKGKGPVLLGEIAQAMGEKGLLGVQADDPKTGRTRWTMFTKLYEAISRIPTLPEPDAGWVVVTSKDDPSLLSLNGKARWLLRRADSAF
jgi:hypothetical protein